MTEWSGIEGFKPYYHFCNNCEVFHIAILIKLSNSGHNLLNKDSVRVFVPFIALSKVRISPIMPEKPPFLTMFCISKSEY